MYVQVLTLARKLGQALQPIKRAHYFRIKYDCRCLFVCVWCVYVRARARVVRLSRKSPPLSQVLHIVRTY